MVRRTVSSTIFILVLALLGGQPAQANTPLTRAVVSSLRNQVRLLPSRKPARKARLSDVLKPGDGIVTSRRSLAELRFNDGSLARMGEQAVFRFIPKTRSFRLSNGTVLMLIPPGQGRTQVRTPNVTAGIRGSALMIRYDKVTDTSTVIALTNSQISVSNRDKSQTQVLAAGQAVVTVGDEIVDSYDVDLQELYRTSELLKDLEMNNPDAEVKDEAIAQVREETLEGIQSQRSFLLGEGRDGTEEFRLSELNVDSVIADETGRPFGTALPGVEAESTRFPGRSIGVDGRFNEEENGELVVSPVTTAQPAAVEPLVTGEPQAIEELQQVVDEPPTAVESPLVTPPIVVESPIVDTPIVENPVDVVEDLPEIDIAVDDVTAPDDTPISELDSLPEEIPIFGDDTAALEPESPGGDLESPIVIDSPVADIPLMDDPVSENPVDDLEHLPGGDDMAGDVIDAGDAPISELDSLPEEIPIFGDDTAALEPESPGGDLEFPIVIDSPSVDIPLMDDPVSENPVDDLEHLPGGDDMAGDVIDTGDAPISELDSLPQEIPILGDDTAALEPEVPGEGGDIDVDNMSPPDTEVVLDTLNDVDTHDPSTVDITITVTVTVEGDVQEFEQVGTNDFQAVDATLEPTPEENGSADGG